VRRPLQREEKRSLGEKLHLLHFLQAPQIKNDFPEVRSVLAHVAPIKSL
jgi:hypothetical protein